MMNKGSGAGVETSEKVKIRLKIYFKDNISLNLTIDDILLRLLTSCIQNLWTSGRDGRRHDGLRRISLCILSILLAQIMNVHVFSRAAQIVFAAIVGHNDFSNALNGVHIAHVLNQAKNIWQRWKISLQTNAIAPHTMINWCLVVGRLIRKILVNTTSPIRYTVL